MLQPAQPGPDFVLSVEAWLPRIFHLADCVWAVMVEGAEWLGKPKVVSIREQEGNR